MELRHLRYFLAIADTLSFTRAAKQLDITQPTLSHQVKQLEKEINSVLFDRVGRKVHLTQSGEVFRGYAQNALREVDSATVAISELEKLIHGKLTIGVSEALSTSLLPPLLAKFLDIYPGVHIIVRQLPTGQLEDQLDKCNLDLGIAYSPPATDKIVVEELFDEPLVLVVGKNHPLAQKKRIQITALNGQPLLLLTVEFPSRRLVDNYFSSAGVKPHVICEINSIQAALATVSSTKLATILIKRTANAVPGLHCIELMPTITRTVAIFWRRSGYQTAAARIMADLIKGAYADTAKAGSR